MEQLEQVLYLDVRNNTKYNNCMDLKVYRKEEVIQPDGILNVVKPDIIDIYPELLELNNTKLTDASILEDDSEELLLQECALATIWQRGLDPVEPEDGIRWSQALLGEVNPLQLIEDVNNAVESITNSVIVEVGTVTSINGQEYLSFKLRMTV